MDLNRIAIFLRVIEAESFTRAASALGLPKSSVSRSVSRLEQDLGVRLVQRTTRKLRLTEAGELYFEQAKRAIAELEEANSAVADMGREARGLVRVTAPVDLGVAVLADAVAAFAKQHPAIRIELSLTARRVDLVEEKFDLAVRAGALADSSLVARKVGESASGLFASPAYLKGKKRLKAGGDLTAHACVLFRARDGRAVWTLEGPDGTEEVPVTGAVSVDDLSFVARAVIAGAGIGIIPMFIGADAVARGELVRVLPNYVFKGAPLHVVMPSARYVPARVTLLRDFLVDWLRRVAWTA
jgi:DNA-binding transcriptional LysR family regulator